MKNLFTLPNYSETFLSSLFAQMDLVKLNYRNFLFEVFFLINYCLREAHNFLTYP